MSRFIPSAPSDLGLVLPGSLPFRQVEAAAEQFKLAKSGVRLSGYRDAANFSLFLAAPITDGDAYIAASYWLSVASRLLGKNNTMLVKAGYFAGQGSALLAMPGSSFFTGKIKSILTEAAAVLQPWAFNKDIAAISAALGHQIREGVDTQMQAQADRSVWTNTAAATAKDIAKAAEVAKGLGTGKKPQGYSDTEWWWEKNKWYAVGGVLTVLVAGAIFRPYIQAYTDAKETR